MENELMANQSLSASMADYHNLLQSGRREILRVES
jgi:hypothetical protein